MPGGQVLTSGRGWYFKSGGAECMGRPKKGPGSVGEGGERPRVGRSTVKVTGGTLRQPREEPGGERKGNKTVMTGSKS